MRLRALALAAAIPAALLTAPLPAQPSDDLRKPPFIEVLSAERTGLQVEMEFVVEGGLSDDALERLRSGLDVRQRHEIDLVTRRSAVWPARIQARMRIETSARYDSLTARYELTRVVRASVRKRKLATVASDRKSSSSIAEVTEWMTRFDSLPPLVLAEGTGDPELKLRIDSTLGSRFIWHLFPARLIVSAERRLER